MLILATFLVFLLAMGGMAIGLALGRRGPTARCGRTCRCSKLEGREGQ